jgi:hypothetical protein
MIYKGRKWLKVEVTEGTKWPKVGNYKREWLKVNKMTESKKITEGRITEGRKEWSQKVQT